MLLVRLVFITPVPVFSWVKVYLRLYTEFSVVFTDQVSSQFNTIISHWSFDRERECAWVCVSVRDSCKERSDKRVSDRNIEAERLREKKKSPVQNSLQLCVSPDYNMSWQKRNFHKNNIQTWQKMGWILDLPCCSMLVSLWFFCRNRRV